MSGDSNRGGKPEPSFDFCAVTGSFLKLVYEWGEFSDVSDCVSRLAGISALAAAPLCRKTAFLKPEFLAFSEPLLREGFSVLCTPDEEYALGLAAVHDFFAHRPEQMLLSLGTLDPVPLLQAVSPCRITYLSISEVPAEPFRQLHCGWHGLASESVFVKSSSSLSKKKSALPVSQPIREIPAPPTFALLGETVQVPLPALEISEDPRAEFSCPEVTENLRERLQEVQQRQKAVKSGRFGKSCSSIKLIDFLASVKECEELEKLVSTAYQSFRWIHEFKGILTPDHSALLRDYAVLAASSLCILRTLHQERCRTEYPDTELFRQAAELLRKVSEKIDGEIPHVRLESQVSPSMISKNFRTLNALNRRKSAVRLRDRLRELTAQLSAESNGRAADSLGAAEVQGASVRIWQEIVEAVSELVKNYGEKPDSPFLIDLLLPYGEDVPEFVTEAEAAELKRMNREKGAGEPEFWVTVTPFFQHVLQALEDVDLQNEKALAEAFDSDSESIFDSDESILSGLSPQDRSNVMRVRKAFQGTEMLFIGGTPDVNVKRRIEAFFGVKLIWEECGHHFAMNRYQAWIQKPEISCFLVKKTWSSHFQYQELLRAFQQSGKRCVRLRSETYPTAIAAKIVSQCLPEE